MNGGGTILAAVVAALALGCQAPAGGEQDSGRADDVSTTDDADEWLDVTSGESRADVRDAPVAQAGPATTVTTEFRVLEERLCDLDGDGDLDNAIADLGVPSSALFASGLSTAIQGRINEELRYLLHIPLVEDLVTMSDPEVVILGFGGVDVDDPATLDDDFSGDAAFYATEGQLDECGEPIAFLPEARLEEGELETGVGTISAPIAGEIVLRGATAMGTIASYGATMDVRVCGSATIAEVGVALLDANDPAGLTLLEGFLAGGAPFGLPMVPGLSPDVDLDGDGLERFETDAEGRIVGCVDGDRSELPGADCWQDPRMADGFSLSARVLGISAVFAGREPGWDERRPEPCEYPPETSLFDPR